MEGSTGFDLQPTLKGERILIRPIVPMDWDEMFLAASDPEIWAQHPVTNRHNEIEFRSYFESAIESGSAFAFIDRQTGRVIGSSRYHGHDPSSREIEIGWTFLARHYWGGSYNGEVKQLMLDHAFGFVDTVVFWIGENNMRSRRAVEKIGGIQRRGNHVRMHGEEEHPYVVYEITNDSRQFKTR